MYRRYCLVIGPVLILSISSVFAEDSIPASQSEAESTSSSSQRITGPTYPVSFFGVQDEARSVVFCLDNSGSMRGERATMVFKELYRTLYQLPKEASFQIYLSFQDDRPFMVDDGKLLPATPKNIARALKFAQKKLKVAKSKASSQPHAVINPAFTTNTDVIYYMSDGQWSAQFVGAVNSANKLRQYPARIHVIGIGVRREHELANLRQIAESNGGRTLQVR